jgi:hypothetical protein
MSKSIENLTNAIDAFLKENKKEPITMNFTFLMGIVCSRIHNSGNSDNTATDATTENRFMGGNMVNQQPKLKGRTFGI